MCREVSVSMLEVVILGVVDVSCFLPEAGNANGQTGGSVSIASGSSVSASSGAFTLKSQDAGVGGVSGSVHIKSGSASSGRAVHLCCQLVILLIRVSESVVLKLEQAHRVVVVVL